MNPNLSADAASAEELFTSSDDGLNKMKAVLVGSRIELITLMIDSVVNPCDNR